MNHETFFARDPLGIKPLYFSDDGQKISFASEVQTLKLVVADHTIDAEAVASYLFWGSIAPPRTLHRSIRAMPPGSWLRIRGDRVEGPETYYRLEDELGRSQTMTQTEAGERLRAALVDSVSHHLIADVPVGSFLSGGVDSSALVGLMAEVHQGPIRTVTLSMDARELDEGDLAQQAATLYGSEHHEIPMGIEQVLNRLIDAVHALDQPSIDGINTYFFAEAAVKAGLKVAVSGVGGDELFGGYGTFQMLPTIERLHARAGSFPGGAAILAAASTLVDRFPRSRNQTRLQRVLGHGETTSGAYFAVRGLFNPSEVRTLLAPEFTDLVDAYDPVAELDDRVRLGDLAPNERISALEFRQYLQCQLLRDTDATAMRHSLEVRTPLVDTELLRAAAVVPASLRQQGPAKKFLRTAPRPPVPNALWARKKQGFTLPFDQWIRGGGISTDLPEHECLDPAGVAAIRQDFFAGKLTWSRLWALVVLREFLN
jgi:asparagine synthase (glutamine-hydrolysing)